VSAIAPAVRHGRRRATDTDRSRIVWSNVNVGEALPGVATPLTWSVLSRFSELGFRKAFGSLGCSVPRDAELVGSFRGRIYLNMSEFMAILSQVPGLRPRTVLSLGGGGEVDRLEADVEPRSRAGFYARLPLTAARFVRENFRLGQRVLKLEELFAGERARYDGMDLRVLSPSGLDKTLRDVEQLLEEAGTVMLTCYGNLLGSVVLLRAVLDLVARDRATELERELLTGLADVESAAPGLALFHIAETARTEPAARSLLLERPPGALRVEDLPDGPTRGALARFLATHGFRGPREAEIMTPRWREDPTMLFAALRAHLSGDRPLSRPAEIERRQRERRERAVAELDRLVPVPARLPVRRLLASVQRFTRLREHLRSFVTEVLGMYRDVALDASRRLATLEPLAGDDAAFFLTIDELHAVLIGELTTVTTLVRQRRRQWERDLSLPDPPDTFVGYPPEVAAAPPPTDVLVGLAASSGRAEGLARVLVSPDQASQLRAGEVLVAPYADVGWSPLFTVAGAVVTDLGGPLSHASIVAREYGVPSVVNVKIATRVIRTGDRLVVDGDAGEVRIVSADASDDLERAHA
jgi:pyruvate,water dikinase